MPVLLHSTSSYYKGINPKDPSEMLPHYSRRDGHSTGPNDLSPITKQYVAGRDEFTFQIMNLKPIYGYGFHTLQVNGTTRNLKSGQNVKIGFVDADGEEIEWVASPTRYGFDIEFFISKKNASGPAIFEIAGVKKTGEILSLIERFVIDTNAPPKPYGVSVKKRGFHTVDIGWFYSTGFGSSNRTPTHDRDLEGFHIWASTSSLTNTTTVTSSAPIKTVLASDAQIPSLTTRSFATSVDGIDQDLIVKDKTLYFYVSSFDDVGNENLTSLKSASLIFGSPGIPTGSNPNVWIPIPEKKVGQLDWSSFSETSTTQSTELVSNKYANAPVYTTGVLSGAGTLSGKLSEPYNNVLQMSSGELNFRSMYITSSVAVTGSENFAKYVDYDKKFTSDGSGALFLAVNTRSEASLTSIDNSGKLSTSDQRMFFVASGSQSFTAGSSASIDAAKAAYSYSFPMLPLKPDTNYIISFRIKATSSIPSTSENYISLLPPLRMNFTGSVFSTKFSMSTNRALNGPAIAPLTFSIPARGPGVDSLLDLTTTQDPYNTNPDDPNLRFINNDDPVRVQIKFNTNTLEKKHAITSKDSITGEETTLGYSSHAPDFDMTLPYFSINAQNLITNTSSIMGPAFGGGWYTNGVALRSGDESHAGGGGIIPSDAKSLKNEYSNHEFFWSSGDGSTTPKRYNSGAGNSGSRFSGTWLGERSVYIGNATSPTSPPRSNDIGVLGSGHFITGSNFYKFTRSLQLGGPNISTIALTGSKEWAGSVANVQRLTISQEQKNNEYPFDSSRVSHTPNLFTQTRFWPIDPVVSVQVKSLDYLQGFPYTSPPGGGNKAETSGTLLFSGSNLPSYEQLGIKPDSTLNHSDGRHHILQFTTPVGKTSKAGRDQLLRKMEAGTQENSISNGTAFAGAAYGWDPIKDSGSFYYYSPPSASLAQQTINPLWDNWGDGGDQNRIKLFSQASDNSYYNYAQQTVRGRGERWISLTNNNRTFYITGSGFLTRAGESNVVAVYALSDSDLNGEYGLYFGNPAEDEIDVLAKLSEFISGGDPTVESGFGVIGQNLGGRIQAADGYGSVATHLGHSGSAVLKIVIPSSTRIGSAESYGNIDAISTMRFKIINRGGFTGSIYNGQGANVLGLPISNFKDDPRCGEYLRDEVNSSRYTHTPGSSLADFRNNTIGPDSAPSTWTELTSAFKLSRFNV